MKCISIALLTATLSMQASAAVLCPRVTSEHNADVTDLARFRQYPKWKDKAGQDLAIAVWQYVCGRETGLYHMSEVLDGPDPNPEFSTVRDPLKALNVYNVGYCGMFGPLLDGIFQGVGLAGGRSASLPKLSHCVTEARYDNAWHYFDLDLRGALIRPDGVVASLAEAQTVRSLWVNPERRLEPFFPEDADKAKLFETYRASATDHQYRWFQGGHTMDFRLRQGESLTRWWKPQGGRWHHSPKYDKGFVSQLLLKEPRGFKSNHPAFSVWTQGNGLWHYEPNLTSGSTDFADGARDVINVAPGKDGLALRAGGVAEAVFEVFTPWIVVPKVNGLDDESDDAEASVATVDSGMPLTVRISTNHGMTWLGAASLHPGAGSLDLTRWVKGTYGFLVKFQGVGQRGDVLLRSLSLDTWVQVAPVSLPRLKAGENRCRYDAGDRYGRLTVPVLVSPNCGDAEDLQRYVVAMPEPFTPGKISSRMKGDVILKLDAPPGATIDWLTAGACFSTFQGQAAKGTDNRVAYAAGQPQGFKEIYRAQCPDWIGHWRYEWDQDILLDQPAKAVYVRYTGKPAVNVLRATLHLKPEAAPQRAVRIVHGYQVGGKPVEHAVEMKEPGDYAVKVDGDPENVFIRLSVPSRTADEAP
jgi:hypothetical protein